MAESSLSMGYPEFRESIGFYLGFGRTSGNWTADQIAIIQDCLDGGLRQFYTPPPTENAGSSHEWTFAKSMGSIATIVDQEAYDLPDDFGGIDGDLTYDTPQRNLAIIVRRESELRKYRIHNIAAGRPQYAAIRNKDDFDGTGGVRYEILFYRIPDAIYNLTYRYYRMYEKLSATNPYPTGGEQHAETIMASMLAFAEERIEDERGLKWENFMNRLSASINLDKRATTSENLGYNGDLSEYYFDGSRRGRGRNSYAGVTYDNVQY